MIQKFIFTSNLCSFSVTSVTFTDDLSNGTWHQVNWVRGQTSINIVEGERSLPLATEFYPYASSVSPEVKIYVGAKPFQTGEISLAH